MQLVHNGTFTISGERSERLVVAGEETTVWDFCLSYACNSDREAWTVAAWACVCFDESAVREVDSRMPSNLTRCCPDTLQLRFDSGQEDIQGRTSQFSAVATFTPGEATRAWPPNRDSTSTESSL